ncbi:MAG: hypothetical protein MJK12_05795 [Colwellia sp.]|nr:hypothetical protein [Colwellia sp.]
MSSQFIPHGECNITVEGNILIVEVEGLWNIEFMQNMHASLLKASQQVDVNNYGLLLILHGEALGAQVAIDYHIEFIQRVNTKAIAINLAHCSIPSMTKHMCEKVYRTVNFPSQYFTDTLTAKNWLKAQLSL